MRELVRRMCSDWAVSIRAACGAIGFDRRALYYKSRRMDQAAALKADQGNLRNARALDVPSRMIT